MKSGLIIYNKSDYQRNVWFVDKVINEFEKINVSLLFIEENDAVDYLKSNKVDFVIYRARNWEIPKQIEEAGIRCFNNSFTNHLSNDKSLTYKLLEKNGIPCIRSFASLDDIDEFPCIMKSIDGHGGKEVFLINSKSEAKDISSKYNKTFVFQKYYKNSGDVRLYLLDKKVVAGVLRHNDKDFRSNYSLGGEVSTFVPPVEMQNIAENISQITDADFIGVDFLVTNGCYLVNEIEDPVGSRMLYKTSKIDIVSLFVLYICHTMGF